MAAYDSGIDSFEGVIGALQAYHPTEQVEVTLEYVGHDLVGGDVSPSAWRAGDRPPEAVDVEYRGGASLGGRIMGPDAMQRTIIWRGTAESAGVLAEHAQRAATARPGATVPNAVAAMYVAAPG